MIRRISKGLDRRYNADKEQWENGERYSFRTDDKAMDYTVWWNQSEDATHAYFLALFENKITNEAQTKS